MADKEKEKKPIISKISLARFKRTKNALNLKLGDLPTHVKATDYVLNKGFRINRLVREIYSSSYEWYGYLLAQKDEPDIAIDIGLGKNARNDGGYTRIEPEEIGEFADELHEKHPEFIINGWIHSHGSLGFRQFSGTDDNNMDVVLSYVSPGIQKPVRKREILVDNLSLITSPYTDEQLKTGTITIIGDNKLSEARILETILGGFSYSIVIGDEGWFRTEISYETRAMLSGIVERTKYGEAFNKRPGFIWVISERYFTQKDLEDLTKEVKEKIKPDRTIGNVIGRGWNYIFHGGDGSQDRNEGGEAMELAGTPREIHERGSTNPMTHVEQVAQRAGISTGKREKRDRKVGIREDKPESKENVLTQPAAQGAPATTPASTPSPLSVSDLEQSQTEQPAAVEPPATPESVSPENGDGVGD